MRDKHRLHQLRDEIAACREALARLVGRHNSRFAADMIKRARVALNSAETYIQSAEGCCRANMEELWLGVAEHDVRSARRHLHTITQVLSDGSLTGTP